MGEWRYTSTFPDLGTRWKSVTRKILESACRIKMSQDRGKMWMFKRRLNKMTDKDVRGNKLHRGEERKHLQSKV